MLIRFVFVFLALAIVILPSHPQTARNHDNNHIAHPIAIEVLRVIDGDTLDVEAHIWLGMTKATRVRLRGIDTPELRGKCQQEKTRAEQAKKALEDIVKQEQHQLVITDIGYGTYAGRIIATVTTQTGTNISQLLIAQGFARAYDGRTKRKPWCGTL